MKLGRLLVLKHIVYGHRQAAFAGWPYRLWWRQATACYTDHNGAILRTVAICLN